MHIFTNIHDLENNYEDIKMLSEDEKLEINNYLQEGGILKTTGKSKLELVYPSKEIIKKELDELLPERSKVTEKIELWNKIKKESEEFIKKK